ncbi:hypothetical protein PsAD46_01024 [Pseudovibrio sp. Ad46]|uniref:hypothetical protein n=1 Tax=unclassified Pseudovibrio TaxID=2627060 RepID=UPI0007AE834C|nr:MULTISPECIES: hypothetical protein [unclassified Pseudovibrio]KZK94601.1 hypothetical protein PsAD46_01024 [Pseudovibrio sp. Ad46]KZL01662.1 hypothetical protein PsAD5_00586 [Pseudovibrio sp. Ad5]
MDVSGVRLSFSFTNFAGNYDPAPIMSQDEVAVSLLEDVVRFTPDNELRQGNELRQQGQNAKSEAEQSNDPTKKAISKIFEVLIGLDTDKMQGAVHSYLAQRSRQAAAIQKFFDISKEWTNPNSSAVYQELMKGIYASAKTGDPIAKEMLQAMKDGTLNIEDMADYGFETKSNYIVYLNPDGEYVFGTSSITHVGDYSNANELFEDLTFMDEEGRSFDKKTGHNAYYVQIAKNLAFYFTWP